MYDEQYVINILTKQPELNLKYGGIFASQSQQTKHRTAKLRVSANRTTNQKRIK